MKYIGIAFLLIILGISNLFSQSPVFNVSDFEARINENEVLLTWTDNEEITGEQYRVLRYHKNITEHNYSKAIVLEEINPGREFFVDTPPDGHEWWYAVMTITTGKIYANFQSWRNAFPLPVIVETPDNFAGKIAHLAEFAVRQSDSQLEMKYVADKDGREIIIFRSLKIIDSLKILDYATIIGRLLGKTGKLTDKPLPGIPYYYAAVDAELFDSAYRRILYFMKVAPPIVATYAEDDNKTVYRPSPLPQIRLSGKLQDGSYLPDISGELPQRKPLSVEAEHVIKSILNSSKTPPLNELKPQILDIDRGSSLNRRQHALQAILTGSFAEQDWKRAESELFALSSSNGLSPRMKNRLLFYHGQTLYFLNHFQDALATFVISSSDYYVESRKWMLVIYDKLSPSS